jgi:hypothetical protein
MKMETFSGENIDFFQRERERERERARERERGSVYAEDSRNSF